MASKNGGGGRANRPTFTDQEALLFHSQGRPGKLEVVATKPMATQRDLSLAYSPGVAVPVLAIAKDVREGAAAARTILHRAGAPSVQQRIGRIEAASARIRSFQPAIVIGLLTDELTYYPYFRSGKITNPSERATALSKWMHDSKVSEVI